MVRHIWLETKDGLVWAEDAPDHCTAGHPGPLRPGWSGCPDCGQPIRSWRCGTTDCTTTAYDDEHVHQAYQHDPHRG